MRKKNFKKCYILRFYLIFISIFILFISSLLFIKINAGQNFELNLKLFDDLGYPLDNVEIYDNNNSLLGKTDIEGNFKIIFYDNLPTFIILYKDGYEKIIYQLIRKKIINFTFILQPLKNFSNEKPFNGIIYKNKSPLQNKVIWIKSGGLLKEVWTDSQGRFSTTIDYKKKLLIFYIERDNSKDSFVENVYIEELNPEEIKDELNYIYTSDFIKKSYNFSNLFKNPSYYFLNLSNNKSYIIIGNSFDDKKYFNKVNLNILSKNDRIFKNYQFFLDLRFDLNKTKEGSILYKLQDEKNYISDENDKNYLISSYDYEIGINFQRKSNNIYFAFENIEAFEEELKRFIFYDKNGNPFLKIFFYSQNYNLKEEFLKNVSFYSFSLIINKPYSYEQFLDDPMFFLSEKTIYLTFFGYF